MIILLEISFLIGGALYRLRGMGLGPRWLELGAFSSLYIIATALITSSPVLAGLVTTFTLLAVATGHGNFQDLGTWTKPSKPERVEFLISWLKPHLPVYWYDALGLSLTGLLVSLPCGLATLNPFIALSGLLKAPAYMIGWKVSKRDPTEWGEFLTGAFLWGSLALICLLSYN